MSKQKKDIFAPYIEVGENLPKHGDKIVFRKEQNDAIDRAFKHLSKSGQKLKFLWNAKMRFGKTICALELVRKLDAKTTLIVTHRPVVDKGWHEDFDKIFKPARLKSLKEDLLAADRAYQYGSRSLEKEEGLGFSELTKFAKTKDGYGIYFVSMQYLALAEIVGGKNTEKQKRDILEFPWDMVIVDEAHEGTQTERGQNVLSILSKPTTKMLHLSGTPFNLYDDFGDDELYTWDYVMEQSAKDGWDSAAGPNPYLTLPKMNIFTYDLGKLVVGKDASFTFAEFFRTKSGSKVPVEEQGKFVHEDWVKKFLDKLCEKSDTSNYPFSTDEYRRSFNHTLWVLPGVKEAKALEVLLRKHGVFKHFEVVNVAGEKDDDEARDNALEALRKKITEQGRSTRSVTLSCGRLTTGVTVPEWSAVFYLKGSENTSASTYMQTIFRTQSPYEFEEGGVKKYKANCYVFDFAPDRSLRMLAETAKFSTLKQSQKKNAKNVGSHDDDIQKMKDFLKFCPVISLDGAMKEFDAERLFTQLNQVYIDRVVRNGFNDNSLYDVQALLDLDVDNLNALGDTIAKSSNLDKPPRAKPLPKDIQMAKGGLKGKAETPTGDDDLKDKENKEEKERKQARREERDRRIKIIRGLALRVPLMMYGAEVTSESEDITRDNFTEKIDKRSWEEFMPRGVTKDDFNKIKSAFNQSIFTGAGKRIRQLARQADDMTVTERIQRIAEIFSYFHNPDKETVLTPWRVVNMHMSDTVGGYCFFNESFTGPNQIIKYNTDGTLFEYVDTNEPRFVNREGVTEKAFFDREIDVKGNPILKSKILEINSKTGLYPLYVAYTLFRARKADFEKLNLIEDTSKFSVEEEQAIWDDILLDNIYVICNTEMAERITRRTLVGFRPFDESRLHIKHMKLVEEATNDQDDLVMMLKSEKLWTGKGSGEMKFNAVVGNPPYQIMDGGNKASATPIYQLFVEIARKLDPRCVSMIIPAKWYSGGRSVLGAFRENMLKCGNVSRLVDYADSDACFPGVDIAGGVCYFLIDNKHVGKCSMTTSNRQRSRTDLRKLDEYDTLIRDVESLDIIEKVKKSSERWLVEMVSAQKPFGLRTYVIPTKSGDINLRYSGGTGPFRRELVTAGKSWVDQYKVIMSYLTYDHAGRPDKDGKRRIFSTMEILGKGAVCTETYIVVGAFKKRAEAENLLGYLKTKFVRFLVSVIATTQHISKESFTYVPVQDFSKPWTDDELYKKYKLTKDEIAFIESMIKPME